jgi:hypothetical protein
MTSDSADVPPGLQAAAPVNGHGTATPPTAAQQTAQGISAIAGMLSQYPQMFANLLSQAVQAMPRPQPVMCATCILASIKWQTDNKAELDAAVANARTAAEIPDGAPLPPDFPLMQFLPAHLQPGGESAPPNVQPKITSVGGTDVCVEHIPGKPGGRQLLIAQGSLNSAMLAGLG